MDWKKNLKYIVAGVGVLAAGVVGAVLISKAQGSTTPSPTQPPGSGGGTPPSGCLSNYDCPTGYNCVNGSCQPMQQCTSDSQCPPGTNCVNGSCQHRIPQSIVAISNTTNWSLDEVVQIITALFTSYCEWGTLVFYKYHDFPFTGQVIDANGNGVADQTVLITTDYSNLFPGPSGVTVTTDSNGMFNFNFKLLKPDAGGAACPTIPGQTTDGKISSIITMRIPGTAVTGQAVASITLYVTGMGI